MKNNIKVDSLAFHRLKNAVDAMQGKTFYCEDGDGVLRRWTPPRPFNPTENDWMLPSNPKEGE